MVDDPNEVKFLKEIEDNNAPNQDVDFQDNDLEEGVIGTIPSSKIVKVKDADTDTDDSVDNSTEETDDLNETGEDEDIDNADDEAQKSKHTKRNTIIGFLAGIAVLLPVGGYYLVNSDMTNPPATALKVILHKQSFKITAPNHVIKMNYLNGRDAPAYIAFYADGKWALSNKDNFGNSLQSATDEECVRHTGQAVASQLIRNGANPKSSQAFSELARMPGIKTTMRYQFTKDGTRVALSIKVSPTKDFKKYFPKDTMKSVTDYDYVFANFKNISRDRFHADMSTSFNGDIDKSSNQVVLSVVR